MHLAQAEIISARIVEAYRHCEAGNPSTFPMLLGLTWALTGLPFQTAFEIAARHFRAEFLAFDGELFSSPSSPHAGRWNLDRPEDFNPVDWN